MTFINVEHKEKQLIKIKRAKIFLCSFVVVLIGCWISLIVTTVMSFYEDIASNIHIVILIALSLLICCAIAMFLYVMRQLSNREKTIRKLLLK